MDEEKTEQGKRKRWRCWLWREEWVEKTVEERGKEWGGRRGERKGYLTEAVKSWEVKGEEQRGERNNVPAIFFCFNSKQFASWVRA